MFQVGKMAKLVLDPVTRIEGHLRIDTEVHNGKITKAWSRGEMFRGFEALLKERDPLDAPLITQRICGVCPVSHAVASCMALENALGIQIPSNALALRNLVLGANYLQSHILHFYQLSALDFVDVEALLAYRGDDPVLNDLRKWAGGEVSSNRILPVAPFLPRLPGDYPKSRDWNLGALAHYLDALEIRKEAHRMAALFGAKMPHVATFVPGGVTCGVDPAAIEDFRNRLRRVRRFIEHVYIPDVIAAARHYTPYTDIGEGVGRYLSFGVFAEGRNDWLPSGILEKGRLTSFDPAKITEETVSSFYTGEKVLHPRYGESDPAPRKEGAYSWLKAPRYGGAPCEVGPLARLLVADAAGHRDVRSALSSFLAESRLKRKNLQSVMGRHAARALEALLIARRMESWLDGLRPAEATVTPYASVPTGEGSGLTEAPRGALGHWIEIKESRIERYQCVVPSTWNFAPRDAQGNPGPVEAALSGTPVKAEYKGLEAARIVRSFDPCIACAVH